MTLNRFCGACGSPVADSDQFCASCGAPTSTPAVTSPELDDRTVPRGEQTAAMPMVTEPGDTEPGDTAPGGAPGRGLRTALLVVLGIAIPVLIGAAVYIAVSGGDDTAGGPVSTPPLIAATTTPATTTPATTTPATAPATTAPPTTAPPTTTPPTTAPATTAPPTTAPPPRTQVALPAGDPASCTVRIGSGGPLADIVDGVATGFDVAFAAELVERAWGITDICFVDLQNAEKITAIETGQIDLLVRGTTAATALEASTDFTTPYLIDGLAVAAPASLGATPTLDGLRVGVVEASGAGGILQDRSNVGEVVAYPGIVPLLEAFDTGQVQAMVFLWTTLDAVYGDRADVDVIFLELTREPVAAFLPNNSPERLALLNAALATMIADGTWREIFVVELGLDPWYEPASLASLPPIGA